MKSVLLGGVLAAIAAGSLGLAVQWGEPESLHNQVQGVMLCRQRNEARESARAEEQWQGQKALVAKLEGADPAYDAAAAAARGDFRLIRGITMMGTYPLGVDCRTPVTNRSNAPPLTLATRFYSDVDGSCETSGGKDPCRTERLLDAYGPSYNRALVSEARYIYSDICRVSVNALPRQIADPVDYGFPDLQLTDAPRTLHEAARRGTPQAVARMIAAATTDAADQPDPYDLTPLAWSVIRRRPDVAAQFLSAGASPIGQGCDEPDRPESPIRLALRTGQEGLARSMMRLSESKRLGSWPAGFLDAAALGGAASILSKMLSEPHEGPGADRIGGSSREQLPAATAGVLNAYVEGLCWWRPVPAAARVRMIGVYEGENDARSRSNNGMGTVTVRLAPSSRPIFLALSAYEPVEWKIIRSPGVRLAGVVAFGMHRPQVTGAGAGVPILINDQRDHCAALSASKLFVYKPGAEQRQIAQGVEHMIGKPVNDFQGSYKADSFELR